MGCWSSVAGLMSKATESSWRSSDLVQTVKHGDLESTFLRALLTHPTPWDAFDKVLATRYHRTDGREMRIVRTFVDSKYRSDPVKSYTRSRAKLGVFSCYGSTVLGRDIVSKPKRSKAQVIYEVGGHEAKSMIYQRARLKPDSEGAYPHGYMHHPVGIRIY
jgi:phage terminase large subunit GpA-like protein